MSEGSIRQGIVPRYGRQTNAENVPVPVPAVIRAPLVLTLCWKTLDLTGSRSRTRTCDPAVNSRLLYRLSYPGPSGGSYSEAASATQTKSARPRTAPRRPWPATVVTLFRR